MKLEHDLIKEILEEIEEKSDTGETYGATLSFTDFSEKNETFKKYWREWYHYKILFDAGLFHGDVVEIDKYSGGVMPYSFSFTSLTLRGQQVLEAMQNKTIWNEIKGITKQAGIKGIKQIPALALAWLMS